MTPRLTAITGPLNNIPVERSRYLLGTGVCEPHLCDDLSVSRRHCVFERGRQFRV
jgi:hypothetical protein